MVVRMETASGLRLYIVPIRRNFDGGTHTLSFLDPVLQTPFKKVEVLFENRSVAKHHKLHSVYLHYCFKVENILPKSIFYLDVDTTQVTLSDITILGYEPGVLARPWMAYKLA
jgi:hypothetical protein